MFVEIPGHFLGVFRGGEFAEPRHVPVEDVDFRLAADNPFRHDPANAAALVEPCHHAIGAEVIPQRRMRPDQRPEVGGKDHRPVDHPLYPGFAQDRHDLDRFFEIPLHAFQIVGQQLVPEIQRCALFGPMGHLQLIGAQQHPHAFLARVGSGFIVVDLGQFEPEVFDQRNVFGHQIVVFDRHQRQFDPRHPRHLAPPQTGGVDHIFGMDRALVGHHIPGAIGALVGGDHGRVPVNGRAQFARRAGKRHGGRGRIHMAALFLPERADHVVGVQHRGLFLGFLQRDEMPLDPQTATGALHHRVAVDFVLGAADVNAAGEMEPAGLFVFLFQLAVDLKGIAVHFGGGIGPHHGEQPPRRVPAGAGCQLLPFQQGHIRPAVFRQMIQDRTADNAAADHHHTCGRIHDVTSGAYRGAGVWLKGPV